jgi:hypothetical protein
MISIKEILEKKSGMYSGINEDGKDVIILREKGCGFTIMEETHNGWFECVDYDEDGICECIRYEK